MTGRRWLKAVVGCGCAGALVALGLACAGVVVPPSTVRALAWMREVERPADVAPGTFVEVDGHAMHLSSWGDPADPLVVLISGTSAWGGTWVEVAVPLAAQGFHVVAPDLPPFGFSARPGPDGYTRAAQGARIVALLDTLGEDGLVLVGHSFGGGATMEAAMTAPAGRLRHLVLLDAALGLGLPPSPAVHVARLPLVGESLVAATFTNPGVLSAGLTSMVHDPLVVTEERVARYAVPSGVEGTTTAVAQWVPELLAPTPGVSSVEASYTSFTVPTTVIWGREDHATPVAQAEHLVGLLPNAELVVLPGVGHLPQIEAPDAVVSALVERIR